MVVADIPHYSKPIILLALHFDSSSPTIKMLKGGLNFSEGGTLIKK